MVQYKAPIRSQTVSPATLGERRNPIDRSTRRQLRQSQHGSDRSDVQGELWTEYPSNAASGDRGSRSFQVKRSLTSTNRPVTLPWVLDMDVSFLP